MAFTLGLAQVRHAPDGDAVALVEKWTKRASEEGVDLLVFPESLMSAYEKQREEFICESQPLDGPFSEEMERIAEENGMWLVYTMNERNDDEADGLPYNTAVIVDNQGRRWGWYRKTHMFVTDFTAETSRMSAGNKLLAPIDTPLGDIGLGICYDLRFPEVARAAALQGCQVMLFPSAWVDGELKVRQWHTLLEARATENQMFVAGVSRCDEGYIGQSAIYGPDGTVIAQGGREECLVIGEIDLDAIEAVRSKMPVLDHRREELYW